VNVGDVGAPHLLRSGQGVCCRSMERAVGGLVMLVVSCPSQAASGLASQENASAGRAPCERESGEHGVPSTRHAGASQRDCAMDAVTPSADASVVDGRMRPSSPLRGLRVPSAPPFAAETLSPLPTTPPARAGEPLRGRSLGRPHVRRGRAPLPAEHLAKTEHPVRSCEGAPR
jgi:hypothetical protein